jgi:uncharacterized membrane protein
MSEPMPAFPLAAPAFNGNSRVVAAGNVFAWLKEGWALFVASPGPWIGLTIVLVVCILGLHIVPVVGMLAANLLTPLLGAGILHACARGADGATPEISDLFAGFKHNASDLLVVGLLYMAAMVIIVLVVVVIGGGSLAGGLMMSNPIGIGLAFGGIIFTLLLALALSVPLFMALWFAPALVFFNNMSPREALKASFNACLKNSLPFLVYGLIVMVLMFFAALPVCLGFLVLVPVLSGSVYASYRDIFVAN